MCTLRLVPYACVFDTHSHLGVMCCDDTLQVADIIAGYLIRHKFAEPKEGYKRYENTSHYYSVIPK